MKTVILVITLLALATQLVAQTATHKPAAKPATSTPTKVAGAPIKTATGLEYWDIKVGTGAVAQSGQHVKVDYTGWLTNGKKFDSSVGTGKPFEFKLGASQVIKGWDEGVAGMKVGASVSSAFPPTWPTEKRVIRGSFQPIQP